jgi:Y-X(10)_GDL-associated radical SAM protein
MARPTRYLSSRDRTAFTPVHAVWEITLACDLKCDHCGSRAGKRRPDELTTEECLDLVRQLARMGTREVTLIGGEAYLRRDWLEIIREVRKQGMDCTMQSGGLNLSDERIKAAADAGLQGLGISIDGLRDVHDRLRGVKGSFDAAFKALQAIRKHGLTSSVNTQITSLVIPQLRELMNLFIEAGAKNWQVQLTVAMGRAADNPELLLQPYQLLELMPLLAELYEEGADRGFLLQPGNNIGYFGPYESVWRGNGDDRVYWTSCNAGQNTLGIEADGTIKGCPSLATSTYAGGNIRDLSLEDIWWTTDELNINRGRTSEELWGYCGSCYYAESCKAGCTWTTSVLFGRAGNNPYCHHRALELSKQGLRERVAQVERAPGTSFDHGRFELILETMDAQHGWPQRATPTVESSGPPASVVDKLPLANNLVQISSPRKKTRRIVARKELVLCRGCNRHVMPETKICPFCQGNIRTLANRYAKNMREAKKAYQRLIDLLPPHIET